MKTTTYSRQMSPDISYIRKYTLGYNIKSRVLLKQIQCISVGYDQLCDYRNISIVSMRRPIEV